MQHLAATPGHATHANCRRAEPPSRRRRPSCLSIRIVRLTPDWPTLKSNRRDRTVSLTPAGGAAPASEIGTSRPARSRSPQQCVRDQAVSSGVTPG